MKLSYKFADALTLPLDHFTHLRVADFYGTEANEQTNTQSNDFNALLQHKYFVGRPGKTQPWVKEKLSYSVFISQESLDDTYLAGLLSANLIIQFKGQKLFCFL